MRSERGVGRKAIVEGPRVLLTSIDSGGDNAALQVARQPTRQDEVYAANCDGAFMELQRKAFAGCEPTNQTGARCIGEEAELARGGAHARRSKHWRQ